jgi:hypothetical protein
MAPAFRCVLASCKCLLCHVCNSSIGNAGQPRCPFCRSDWPEMDTAMRRAVTVENMCLEAMHACTFCEELYPIATVCAHEDACGGIRGSGSGSTGSVCPVSWFGAMLGGGTPAGAMLGGGTPAGACTVPMALGATDDRAALARHLAAAHATVPAVAVAFHEHVELERVLAAPGGLLLVEVTDIGVTLIVGCARTAAAADGALHIGVVCLHRTYRPRCVIHTHVSAPADADAAVDAAVDELCSYGQCRMRDAAPNRLAEFASMHSVVFVPAGCSPVRGYLSFQAADTFRPPHTGEDVHLRQVQEILQILESTTVAGPLSPSNGDGQHVRRHSGVFAALPDADDDPFLDVSSHSGTMSTMIDQDVLTSTDDGPEVAVPAPAARKRRPRGGARRHRRRSSPVDIPGADAAAPEAPQSVSLPVALPLANRTRTRRRFASHSGPQSL